MHRPVVAPLAIFARAVDRIDDPRPRLEEPRSVALAFFGQQAVIGALAADRVAQQVVGRRVAGLAEFLRVPVARRAHLEQQLARRLGDMRGEIGVGHAASPSRYATIRSAASSALSRVVSMWISGATGTSYGLDIPVKLTISPVRALRYSHLASRASATSSGVSPKISTNSPAGTIARAIARSAANGEMNAVSTISPASVISFATSPTRRIFSTRSASVKPRSRLRPCRRLSPSSR